MNKIRVEMPASILADPSNWEWKDKSTYMSGHCYRGTSMEAMETIDSCDNCDGSRCDNCEERTVPEHWELSVYSDDLYDALKETGLGEDAASDLAYNDFGCDTHVLNWDYQPSEEVLHELEERTKI